MKNKSFLLNYNNLIIFSYFIIIFFFSLTKVGDYGATIDDYIYYINGVHTYEYVKHIFLSIFNEGINLDLYRSSINEFPVFYEFVLVSICKLLNPMFGNHSVILFCDILSKSSLISQAIYWVTVNNLFRL